MQHPVRHRRAAPRRHRRHQRDAGLRLGRRNQYPQRFDLHRPPQEGHPRRRRDITDLRDIYENNANQGARRVREAIFAVLPQWFTEEAQELCQKTLAAPTGDDLAKKIDTAVKAFDRRGITVAQLEEKVGVPRRDWTGEEYAQLDVLYGSLRRGEISQDEAFPPARVTVDDLTPAGA